MKKWFSLFLLLLALAGCGDSSKPVRPEDMKQEYIHFAASLALEDIIRKGEASPYLSLSPSLVLNPYRMLDANGVIEDFRRDFTSAEDKYYRLRSTGTVIRGTVRHVDPKTREVVFVREETIDNKPFTGILRLSPDQKFYEGTPMPVYETGAAATFMCAEYRPVHDFKNESMHKVEIRLIQCKAADDYYAEFQGKIKTRLMAIYAGKESVNPALAKGLAALYLAGNSLPEDSVCFSGSFLSCSENLAVDLARKWGDIKVEHVGAMRIDPEKNVARRLEQIQSEPAERPENADRSPSGEKVHEQPAIVKEQKEAISQVKVPPPPSK